MTALREYPCDVVPESIAHLHASLIPLLCGDTFRVSMETMRLLRAVDCRKLTLRLIEEICGDPGLLRTCAARSETHPLGFDKFVLFSTKQYQLRLHVWWPSTDQEYYEDIHNHRFDFVSCILLGRVVVELYEIATSGQHRVLLLDHPRTEDGTTYCFTTVGDVFVDQVSTHELVGGSAYITRSDSLHRVVPDRGTLLATLFLKRAPVRSDANVLVEPATAGRATIVDRALFDVGSACAALEKVSRHLRD